ncbi:cutinase [Rhodococcus oxybenzonivorans]|uniref:Cutinase n=1 Tax=Rhodococcus oxybenzonivorans TaxID=1990687 RepID=A0A2S2BNP1_9NOCA|nr:MULTISPECIES: cutinase family protein [Rhodococcus]AWK70245.1 cutinase [Rhodococcus oxybenzonivorans]QTJ69802.1 cutinase family protein [Rhodococcus sp. ZPP]
MKRVIATLTATAAAVAIPVVSGVVGTSAVANADPCPSLYVVAIPGTWETSTKENVRPTPGLLSAVTNGLPSNIRTDYVTYAATAFPWEGDVYGRSKAQAVDNARGMLVNMSQQCAGTKLALIGYSQGADAAGDLAAEIGTGLGAVPADKIAAVGLVSDPRRSPTDALVGPPVAGGGAGGPRIGGFGWVSQNTRTFCAYGDLYCSTPKEDFVTRLAGFLAQTSDPSPSLLGRYQAEAEAIWRDLLDAGGVPTLMAQLDESANQRRIDELEQFYKSQAHQDYTRYAVDGAGTSATNWLRNWLRDVA